MKCPHCRESVLILSERKGIEIDYCPDCRGIWLDRGELDKILEKSREEEPETRRDSFSQPATSYPQNPHPGYHPKHYKRKKSFLEELFD